MLSTKDPGVASDAATPVPSCREAQEQRLDDALRDSFPASDPIALNRPETLE